MVECGWNSPEAISACVAIAQSWLKTVGDLVGLGSAALLTILSVISFTFTFAESRPNSWQFQANASTEQKMLNRRSFNSMRASLA